MIGVLMAAFGAYYLASPPPNELGVPTHDEYSLGLSGLLIVSGIGLIAQKKAAFHFYLFGAVVFTLKAVIGALGTGESITTCLFLIGLSAVLFGLPALFVWARSDQLKPWFDEAAE